MANIILQSFIVTIRVENIFVKLKLLNNVIYSIRFFGVYNIFKRYLLYNFYKYIYSI